MAIYAGLSPTAALQKWYQLRHTDPGQMAELSPEEQAEARSPGGMVTLAQENPAAWQFMKTGTPTSKDKLQVFNPMTGEFDEIKKTSLWSHWETWAQIIGGGILGGFAAAPYLAGTAGTTAGTGGVDAATVGAGSGVGVEGAGAGLGAVEGGGYGITEGGLAALGPSSTGALAIAPGASTIAGTTTLGELAAPASIATEGTGATSLGTLGVPASLSSAGVPAGTVAPAAAGAPWYQTPLGLGAIGSGINAAANIYGINKQADAANQAAILNSQSAAAQLAYLQQKDAADRAAQVARDAEAKREWDLTTGLNLAQWNRRQAQLEPDRQKSLAAGQELNRRLGLPAPTGGWDVPNPPVTLNDAALYGGTNPYPTGSNSSLTPSAPVATDASLSDPAAWMALVGNDAQLTAFVTKGLGNAASVPGLVDYYKGKVKGQPGANAAEQAGSAAYWNEKFANDPHNTGSTTTLAAMSSPTLTRAPFQPSASSLAAFTPTVITAPPTMTLASLYPSMAAV